jgi:aspartyl-tRNA(Asn)/glutamyl-tRNA(Gln) amidotransferase subunit A
MGIATQSADKIRTKQLSPVDLLNDCLEKISAIEETVHAWVTIDKKGALSLALKREQEARNGMIRGVLHGIPVGVKDIFDVKGLPTLAGAASFAHRLPTTDATVITKLKEAGAIILGKTETTQFAFSDHAPTRNPWNIAHTPGGSSSGSAVAVATGHVPLAIGSQTVGSTLRPAAFCGIVGLKPTYGLLSTQGVVPLAWSLDHVGLLSSDVSDAMLGLRALTAGSTRVESAEWFHGNLPSIGLLGWDYEDQPTLEMNSHIQTIASVIHKVVAPVTPVPSPAKLISGLSAGFLVMRSEAAAYHQPSYSMHAKEYRPKIRELIESGFVVSATDYIIAQRLRKELRQELVCLLKQFDALLLPVTGAPPPEGLTNTGVPNPFCAMATFTGLPSISLPSGLSATGLPLSVQLVGGPWQENRLLKVAELVENAIQFNEKPSPVT